MAKKNKKRSYKGKAGGRLGEATKIVALLVFIFIGLGIVAGSVWYYAFFQPQAEQEIEIAAAGFAKEYFDVDYRDISGQEGKEFMTADLARRILASGRADAWKEQALITQVTEDVEVNIVEQKLRTAWARVIFWQREQAKEQEDRSYLIYYDLDLVRSQGRWQVDQVRVPQPEELKDLRLNRNVPAEESE